LAIKDKEQEAAPQSKDKVEDEKAARVIFYCQILSSKRLKKYFLN
jgi:hypothetical protein